ncbi:universal stress protein [Amycolatopsis sp. NPDC059657]|uniref:universal stress protein n=1 Tax=Amycolatopsis sp. NPDC059657 TaxID=3346899 RepID=UPI00366D949E
MNTAEGKIVVGVDGTEQATRAVRWAAGLASARRLGLVLVHALRVEQIAYGGGIAGPTPLFDFLNEDGKRILDDAVEQARAVNKDLAVETLMPPDSPVPYLLDLSKTARMVVVGGAGESVFGSTISAVVSHADCPVAVVRGTAGPGEGPVVAGVDGSPLSEAALATAFEEASLRGVPLIAVHAWRDTTYDSPTSMARLVVQWESLQDEEERLLAQRLAGWQEKYPDVTIERVLVRDRPRHALLEWSEKAQLVVVGSRGRGGFAGLLLGSVSQALAHHAHCPVLVIRSKADR